MKIQRLILSVVIALISAFSTTAQDIITINSNQNLSKEHKQLLKQTKNIVKKNQNKIFLPIVVNQVLGDTIAKTNYIVMPMWEECCFIELDSMVLIVPLYNESLQLLQCQLKAESFENKIYSVVIETLIGTFDKLTKNFTGDVIYSTCSGDLIEIHSYTNGECSEIIKNEYATTKSSPNLNRLKSNYKFIDLSTKTLKRVREEKNKHRPLNWEEGERHKIWQQTQNRR
ncbi:MAG: hypothetical protein E7080_07010 [Bacteroidales bacterium]|nr:hypothetical protein [Bacteroidales bacterium]